MAVHPWHRRLLQISAQLPVHKYRSNEHWPKSLRWPTRITTGREAPSWGAIYGPKTSKQGGVPLPILKGSKTGRLTKRTNQCASSALAQGTMKFLFLRNGLVLPRCRRSHTKEWCARHFHSYCDLFKLFSIFFLSSVLRCSVNWHVSR